MSVSIQGLRILLNLLSEQPDQADCSDCGTLFPGEWFDENEAQSMSLNQESSRVTKMISEPPLYRQQ
jgi:hypothetical protein